MDEVVVVVAARVLIRRDGEVTMTHNNFRDLISEIEYALPLCGTGFFAI